MRQIMLACALCAGLSAESMPRPNIDFIAVFEKYKKAAKKVPILVGMRDAAVAKIVAAVRSDTSNLGDLLLEYDKRTFELQDSIWRLVDDAERIFAVYNWARDSRKCTAKRHAEVISFLSKTAEDAKRITISEPKIVRDARGQQ